MDCLKGQIFLINMAESESKAKLTVKLTQEDIPGAKLPRDSVEKCSVVQLKRWLLCRGAKTTGTKKALVSRFVSKLATFKLRTFTRVRQYRRLKQYRGLNEHSLYSRA